MENVLKMPMNYCVMTEEEMTYTEGGATAIQALCAWVVPFYGWYKGKKNPDNWTEKGLDALSKDMEKSPVNLLYDVACSLSVASSCLSVVWLIPNAIIVFGT